MLLENKVVIVSGIGPGLGQELSTLAAKKEGAAAVVLAARTPAKLDIAEQEIKELGLDTAVLKVTTDISDAQQCQALAEKTVAEFGRIDVLFNSAYDPGSFGPIESANMDDWRRAMDVNFFGTMALSQACIPAMKKAGGSIVMIGTMVEHKPMATQAGYGASKSALRSATKHLALELGQYKIRVNSCHMGWMWGPSVETYFSWQAQVTGKSQEELIAGVTRNIPLGVIPDDADCARAAVFFASDYSSVVTGASLDVNGGEFMPI